MFASCCGAGCCFLKIISSYFLTRGWDSYNALCDIEQDVLEREKSAFGGTVPLLLFALLQLLHLLRCVLRNLSKCSTESF